MDTLHVKPQAKGVDTTSELIKFYEEHYSANIMHLVVYGKGMGFLANTKLKLLFLSIKIGNSLWSGYFQKALTKFKILWKECSRKSKTPTKASLDSLVSHVLRSICRSLFLFVNSEYSCYRLFLRWWCFNCFFSSDSCEGCSYKARTQAQRVMASNS